jgi:hypothetical protein
MKLVPILWYQDFSEKYQPANTSAATNICGWDIHPYVSDKCYAQTAVANSYTIATLIPTPR